MSMYGVPASQCEPIRNRRSSPMPRNRFLEPEAVIAEGIKGGGKTLPANVFSVPSRTIGGRIRKISQYSTRSTDDDDDDDRSYHSAAEEDTDDSDKQQQQQQQQQQPRRKRPSIARSRSENDVSRGDEITESRRVTQSPFLTVPDQQKGLGARPRSRSTKSTGKAVGSCEDLRVSKRRQRSPKTRRKSVPVNSLRRSPLGHRTTPPPPQLDHRTTPSLDPFSAGRASENILGMSGSALAGAGMLALGVGGGGGAVKGAIAENYDSDDLRRSPSPPLRRSPSPPIIEINLTEEDGHLRRINSDADDDFSDGDDDDEMEKSVSPPPFPPVPPAFSAREVEEMRCVLKFFFMDPIQKWKAKRRFPWKLCLQLLKIVFITVQLCLFGSQRSAFIVFSDSNKVAFEHLYLQDWDPALEGMPYPPPRGPYAVYDKDKFFEIIDYAINNYFNTSDLAVGTYAVADQKKYSRNNSFGLHPTDDDSYIPPPEFCQSFYPNASIDPEINSYSFPLRAREECIVLSPNDDGVSIRHEIAKANMTIDFDALINITLKFKVKTIHFRNLVALDFVTCYIFDVNIFFDNHDNHGKIPITLKIKDHWLGNCSGVTAKSYHEDEIIRCLLIFFDGSCILISALSMILCLRSIMRAFKLCHKTDAFLIAYKGNPLSSSERWEFVNFWYLSIVLNDILAIIGSFSKILMETKVLIDWNMTGFALGTSTLLVWIGVLRYLSFFSRYNILIVTLKHAMPDLIRFLVCTLVLFFGFVFCGWAVLGPYNLKFRSIWTTMMCLFSLVNGDDMFVTFTASSPESTLIWYYSQLYLYAFICLFIYVNISLFTAVILDSYSLIKYYYQHGFPKSDLFEFIDELSDPPEGQTYRERSLSTLPMQRRPKSSVSQHSAPAPADKRSNGSASAASAVPPSAQTKPPSKWVRLKASASAANCFRCCRGEGRSAAANSSGLFNHSRINRSDSHRQHLVYASESDDDDDGAPLPGTTVHM